MNLSAAILAWLHQFPIDSTLIEHAKSQSIPFYTASNDVRKAFDSVNQAFILKLRSLYRVHPDVLRLLQRLIRSWNTSMIHGRSTISSPIALTRGILHGDSPTPFLFFMKINPSSVGLRELDTGIRLPGSATAGYLNHLLYVDDNKLYATSLTELHQNVRQLSRVLQAAGLSINRSKCAFTLPSCVEHPRCTPSPLNTFPCLSTDSDIYKYLIILQNSTTAHTPMSKQVFLEILSRVRKVLKLPVRDHGKLFNSWSLHDFRRNCVLVDHTIQGT